MAIGLKDIAQECGLSAKAVSDILNHGRTHSYRPETCERVQEAARRLNYRPNRTAQTMRSRRTHMIGFVAPAYSSEGLMNYNIHPFLVGLSHGLTERGYHASLVELKELETGGLDELPSILHERFFDALVIHYGLSPGVRHLLPEFDVPALWWDSGVFEPQDCLYRDERKAGRTVTRRLIEAGHRRIAFFGGHSGWESYLAGGPIHYSLAHRYEGYRAEMRAHGLEETVITGYEKAEFAARLRELEPTALILLGLGAGTALLFDQTAHELGWRIPRELSLAVLDREARLPQRGVLVGGLSYDRYAAGRKAAEMTLQTLETGAPVPSVKLLGDFEMGDTIAPARHVRADKIP
jgi:LacI family transcriptional regulator